MLLNSVSLRQAGAADWPAVQALLLAQGLPTAGAREHLATFVLAHSKAANSAQDGASAELLGCAGAEVAGNVAMLRSVAVASGHQRQGLGRLMVQTLLQQALARDMHSIHLLTLTAADFFAQFGFRQAARAAAPPALGASAEFRGACPDSATFMSLNLQETTRSAAAPAIDAPNQELPVAVLGAGPVGLAAVANLIERGQRFVVLEAGASVGANLLDWGHVQLFSPWQYNLDASTARLLGASGWQAPPAHVLPTAADIVQRVLQPFAALPAVAQHLLLGARVLSVSREGFDKVKSAGREQAAFVLRYRMNGGEHELRARAVIDASGTWRTPNPLGASGLPAIGEPAAADRIAYGMPDIAGRERARYAGRRTLVVGAGHSAANSLLALAALAREVPGTRLAWAVRSSALQRVFGGGRADALPARGQLGSALKKLRDDGGLEFFSGLRVHEIRRSSSGALSVLALDAQAKPLELAGIDEIICATGQRPDLTLGRELRLTLDPWLESSAALGPLIDPNQHSCGTVRPHGHRELAHAEPGIYTVGVKSYGRAPTFLLATGFEQARSVVAALAGDLQAADRVQLVLPETGVCSLSEAGAAAQGAACCGSENTLLPAGAVAAAAGAGAGAGACASACAAAAGPENVAAAAAPRVAQGCCGSAPRAAASRVTSCCN